MLDAVARAGGGWFRLRAATWGQLVREALDALPDGPGLEPVPEELHAAYVELAYRAAPRKYFPASVSPGLIASLSATVRELLRHGIRPDALRSAQLEPPEKASDLAAILEQYVKRVRADGWGVPEDIADRAASAGPSEARLLLGPGLRLSEVESEFLAVRFPNRILLTDDMPVGLEPPAGLLAGDRPSEPHRGAFLFHPAAAPDHGPAIDVFRAIDEDAEVREVLRRALELSVPADEVEIALADYAAYAPIIADAVAGLGGVEVTFGRGLPGARTGPVRAALGLANWLAGGFAEPDLRRIVAAGDLALPDGLSPGRAANLLREARIGWGRERYRPCLEALSGAYRARAQDAEDADARRRYEARAKQAKDLASWCDALLGVLPAGTAALSSRWDALRAFLDRAVRVRSPRDGEAMAALRQALAVPPGCDVPVTEGDAAQRLRALAAGVWVGAAPPRPGALHVCGLDEAGLSGRTVLFLPGLDLDRIPGPVLEDPILGDRERERVALGLLPSNTAVRERLWAAGRAVSRARGRVVLSYPCRAPAENRERFASPVILGAVRLGVGDPSLGYAAVAEALGAPAGHVPRGRPLVEREWWYRELEAGGLFADGRAAVLAAYPHLASGAAAQRALEDLVPGPHHGRLTPSSRFDPRRNPDTVLSASALETYASCPRRYLLQYLLRIPVPDEVVRDPGTWLDPLSRGTLLHRFYARFVAERPERASQESERARALALMDELVEECREQIPVPSEPVFERERRGLRQDALAFVRFVARHRGRPVAIEAWFGGGGGGDLSAEPVAIPAGPGAIRLRGAIDRIDRAPVGDAYWVWDYKTGMPRDYLNGAEIAGGRKLQHVLYAEAAERLLGEREGRAVRVTRCGYLFPTDRAGGVVVAHPRRVWRRGLRVLPALCDAMAQGLFVPTGRQCSGCAFGRVCGGNAEIWERLREADDPAVRAYREVEEHA